MHCSKRWRALERREIISYLQNSQLILTWGCCFMNHGASAHPHLISKCLLTPEGPSSLSVHANSPETVYFLSYYHGVVWERRFRSEERELGLRPALLIFVRACPAHSSYKSKNSKYLNSHPVVCVTSLSFVNTALQINAPSCSPPCHYQLCVF